MALLEKLPADTPVYSNGRDAIYYLTGRRTLDVPAKFIRGTGQPNQQYEVEVEKMGADLRQHHGVLVYFNTLPERWSLPLAGELKSQLPLVAVATELDGSIYNLALTDDNHSGH